MQIATNYDTTLAPTPLAGLEVANVQNLSKRYGHQLALNNLNLGIRSGELLALLGPNGAGKTTLVRILLGLTRPDSGCATVFGSAAGQTRAQARIGMMLQVGRVPETLTVAEHIDLFSSYYPKPLRISETLEIAALTEIKDRKFGELSGGQKQRALFGIAICGNPDLLFLDEPTVGLDVDTRRLMWRQIRALVGQGKTILLTTHYLNEADELADRIAVLDKGQIVAEGTPAEIKTRATGKHIRCTSTLTAEEVRRMPGVISAQAECGRLELQVNAAEPVIRDLLARDCQLTNLEVVNAGLEEAFLALTNNQSSDSSGGIQDVR